MCSKTDQARAHVHGHVCDSASYESTNLHICISHMIVMWHMVNGMQNNHLPAAYMWLQVMCLELITSALAPVQIWNICIFYQLTYVFVCSEVVVSCW